MTSSESLPVTPSFDLHAAVRRQPWTWLDAIVRRLNLAIEIVDERGNLCAPIVSSPTPPSLRRMLSGTAPTVLRAACASALVTGQTQRASVENVDVFCLPLMVGHDAIGVVALARQSSSAAAPSDAEIDAAGSWLARAIEAQLDVPGDDGEAFDRVSSLHRLLHEAVERGIERDILIAFTEALIAWDDIEVRAYVEDVRGRLTLSVATPGTDRLLPSSLADQVMLREASALVRLSLGDAARLGFRRDKDVMVARIGSEYSQPWLLVFSGALTPRDESRLSLYVDLLREAVARVATIAETRTSWAILQALLAGSSSVEETGEAALAELTGAVDALGSALVVTAPNGVHVLNLGDGGAFSSNPAALEFDQLVSTLPVLDAHTLVLAVRRPQGQAFTRREQQLVDRAAATFAAWLPGALRRSGHDHERRTESRDFDRILDRVAAQNIADGIDVIVLVVLAPAAVSRPGLLHKWVADIRGQLRASDLAGALSDREIGVLLSGTTIRDLGAVRTRILRHVALPESAAAGVAVGVSSHSGGAPADVSLVRTARQNAVRRVAGGEWP